MKVYYAIGDIHGRDDLLKKMHKRIRNEHKLKYKGAKRAVVYIGDYIDSGSHSREVIDRVMRGLPDTESICLLGNHEALMRDCLETDNRNVWRNWLNNGGEETVKSFEVSFRSGGYDPDTLKDALGPARLAWIEALRPYHIWKKYLFVHAGIRPGVPIKKQVLADLLWIRRKFIKSDADHGYRVIHGHTPKKYPDLKHNRISIDTGAKVRGKLTAVVLRKGAKPYFLTVTGKPGRG